MSHRLHAALAGLAGAILAGACGFSTHGTLEPGQGGATTTTSTSSSATTTTTTTFTSSTGTTTTSATGGTGGTGSTTSSTGGGGTTTTGTGGGVPDSCTDNKKSPDETDVDCGGNNQCQRCIPGRTCTADSDCNGGSCAGGVCCTGACTGECMSCNDAHTGMASGTCAQATAGKDPGGLCAGAGIGTCDANGMCSCKNNVLDSGETDVDCGGSACPKCADGLECGGSGDCANNYCVNTSSGKICCDQGCGGPCQACNIAFFLGTCKPRPLGNPCGGGKGCDANVMCVSGSENGVMCGSDGECMSNRCVGNPTKCQRHDPPGYPCTQGSDCASGTCDGNTHLCG